MGYSNPCPCSGLITAGLLHRLGEFVRERLSHPEIIEFDAESVDAPLFHVRCSVYSVVKLVQVSFDLLVSNMRWHIQPLFFINHYTVLVSGGLRGHSSTGKLQNRGNIQSGLLSKEIIATAIIPADRLVALSPLHLNRLRC